LELMMTLKEAERISVMEQLTSKKLKQREASERLNLSLRQVQRIARNYHLEGAKSLVSKRRGKPNPRRIKEEQRERIIGLIQV